MTSNREYPQTTAPDNRGATTETHPAYGQITASRVHGRGYLYGSDFEHQNYVSISVYTSELVRDLSTDWPHAGRMLISLSLSEAQWAAFVSSMNVGEGTRCTLEFAEGREIAKIAGKAGRKDQFSNEMRDCLSTVEAGVKRLRAQIDNANIPSRVKKELFAIMIDIENHLSPNITFVSERFGSHIETVTEHAKIEVNAYIQGAINRAGLQALNAPITKVLEEKDDEPSARNVHENG